MVRPAFARVSFPDGQDGVSCKHYSEFRIIPSRLSANGWISNLNFQTNPSLSVLPK